MGDRIHSGGLLGWNTLEGVPVTKAEPLIDTDAFDSCVTFSYQASYATTLKLYVLVNGQEHIDWTISDLDGKAAQKIAYDAAPDVRAFNLILSIKGLRAQVNDIVIVFSEVIHEAGPENIRTAPALRARVTRNIADSPHEEAPFAFASPISTLSDAQPNDAMHCTLLVQRNQDEAPVPGAGVGGSTLVVDAYSYYPIHGAGEGDDIPALFFAL